MNMGYSAITKTSLWCTISDNGCHLPEQKHHEAVSPDDWFIGSLITGKTQQSIWPLVFTLIDLTNCWNRCGKKWQINWNMLMYLHYQFVTLLENPTIWQINQSLCLFIDPGAPTTLLWLQLLQRPQGADGPLPWPSNDSKFWTLDLHGSAVTYRTANRIYAKYCKMLCLFWLKVELLQPSHCSGKKHPTLLSEAGFALISTWFQPRKIEKHNPQELVVARIVASSPDLWFSLPPTASNCGHRAILALQNVGGDCKTEHCPSRNMHVSCLNHGHPQSVFLLLTHIDLHLFDYLDLHAIWWWLTID